MTKQERHRAILEIVKDGQVATQAELVEALARLRMNVTQGTVSRDVKALGLQKTRTARGRTVYAERGERPVVEDEIALRRALTAFVREVKRTENLIVVKTSPGGAQGVAALLDQADLPGVLGTVAGDDTILVVAKNGRAGQSLARRLGGI